MIRYIDDIRKAKNVSEKVVFTLRRIPMILHSTSISYEEGKEIIDIIDKEIKPSIKAHYKDERLQKDLFMLQ